MTFSSSHDFDPITREDIEDLKDGLKYDKPTEILQIEMGVRALGDAAQVEKDISDRATANVSSEEVARIARMLGTSHFPDQESKVAKYPPDPAD